MDSEDPAFDSRWDEYQWERFLQQQDRKTERYMELLERYIDNPDRDAIIAREMGWSHLESNPAEEEDWDDLDGPDFLFEDEEGDEDDEDDEDDEEETDEDENDEAFLHERYDDADSDGASEFESHPLFKSALALTLWTDRALGGSAAEKAEASPGAVQLFSQITLCSAKLAAALSGDSGEEPGMTIAYLKRALHAISTAFHAAAALEREKIFTPEAHTQFRARAFPVRDEIIRLMGEYREEWRRLQDN